MSKSTLHLEGLILLFGVYCRVATSAQLSCSWASLFLVLRGQTIFGTEGKGLGYRHTATCRRGVRTNHSTVFSHMIPEVCD